LKTQIQRLTLQLTLQVGLLLPLSTWGQDVGWLHLEKKIPLPGVAGRIDHFSADVLGKRLFVAALGNGSVEIVDVERGQRTAEIKDLEEPQGVYFNSKENQLYVATGGDGKVRIYDGTSLTLQSTLDFGDDADNLRLDPKSGDICVGFGNGGIGIIDSSNQKVGTIALGSHPESFQFDPSLDRVYVNIPKQLGVAVIDRTKRLVVAKWGLGGGLANYPMALDQSSHRLFLGCRLPARLVVLDTSSGRNIATLPTVGDADEVFYDESRHLVYIVGGEGAVDVLRQRDADHYEEVGRTATASGARTGYWSASSNRLYVAAPARRAEVAAVFVYAVD
jgi:DNA-binding beta-propeller fold protein YncE